MFREVARMGCDKARRIWRMTTKILGKTIAKGTTRSIFMSNMEMPNHAQAMLRNVSYSISIRFTSIISAD